MFFNSILVVTKSASYFLQHSACKYSVVDIGNRGIHSHFYMSVYRDYRYQQLRNRNQSNLNCLQNDFLKFFNLGYRGPKYESRYALMPSQLKTIHFPVSYHLSMNLTSFNTKHSDAIFVFLCSLWFSFLLICCLSFLLFVISAK